MSAVRQKFTPELKQALDQYSITNATAQGIAGVLARELSEILHDDALDQEAEVGPSGPQMPGK